MCAGVCAWCVGCVRTCVGYTHTGKGRPCARARVNRAEALRPRIPEGHRSLSACAPSPAPLGLAPPSAGAGPAQSPRPDPCLEEPSFRVWVGLSPWLWPQGTTVSGRGGGRKAPCGRAPGTVRIVQAPCRDRTCPWACRPVCGLCVEERRGPLPLCSLTNITLSSCHHAAIKRCLSCGHSVSALTLTRTQHCGGPEEESPLGRRKCEN